jgi:two-component system sensor histidine kinase HupT/HoxJ
VSDDQRVILLVRDHGPGIPPAHLARVFEPFFTTKKIGEGTGLGLYISYGLAEELGGSLSVHNHSKGGAEFALVIPLRDKAYEE